MLGKPADPKTPLRSERITSVAKIDGDKQPLIKAFTATPSAQSLEMPFCISRLRGRWKGPSIFQFVSLPALVLAGQLLLGGCGQKLSPTEYVTRAQGHFEKGEFRAASVELSNALEQNPEAVEARLLMAKVALNLGDGARAEKEITKAMEFGLPRASGYPILIKTLFFQGNLDRTLKEAASLPSDTSQADKALVLGLKGQALVLKGQPEQGAVALDDALAIVPGSSEALLGKAIIHSSKREYGQAQQLAEQALKTDPRSPEAWSILGSLQMAQGKPSEAASSFGNAVKQRDYPSLDQAKRALALMQIDRLKDAELDIQTLQQQGWQQHPYVSYVSGLLYFKQKKYSEAAAAFETTYAEAPDFLPARMYLATTSLMLGRQEQAISHAQYALRNAPNSRTAQQLLGAVEISRSDYGSAKDILQTALRKSPEDMTTLRMLAAVSVLSGDTAKGLEYSIKVASLDPQAKQAQDMLLLAKLMAGQSIGDGPTGDQASKVDNYTLGVLSALEAFRNKKIERALSQAKKLHERYPDKVDPINLMAACYLAAGQSDKAKVELERALKLKPNHPSATRNLAKIEAHGGNLERSRALLQGLNKEQPGDEDTALLLAEVETRLGNQPTAIAVLERAVKDNPNALAAREKLASKLLESHNLTKVMEVTRDLSDSQLQKQPALLELRGKAQMLSGDIPSARATFERWSKLAPDSPQAHFYYSDALAQGGQPDQARKELERAVQLDAKYLPARVGEVKMLVHSRELEKANKALVKLRQDFGERAEVLAIEGWYALGTSNYPTAQQRLAAALQRNPDPELVILLSRAYWAQEKHGEAIKVMQSWLKDQPNDKAVLLHLAGGYLSLKRNDEAIATYAKVVELSPDHVPALNNLAWLNRDKDLQKATGYAERAYRIAPSDPYVLDTLGMLALKNGDAARAHGLIQEASSLAPSNLEIQLHLAQALIQMQQNAKATKVLEGVVNKGSSTQPGREAQALMDSISSSKR